jgi:hypothetical protein
MIMIDSNLLRMEGGLEESCPNKDEHDGRKIPIAFVTENCYMQLDRHYLTNNNN